MGGGAFPAVAHVYIVTPVSYKWEKKVSLTVQFNFENQTTYCKKT